MSPIGDDENLYDDNISLDSDYVAGGAAEEEDPFSALDDFSAEGNADEPVPAAEAAQGVESGKEGVAETGKAEKAPLKQMTPEEIKKIAEKNKREKKLVLKQIAAREQKAKKAKKPKKAGKKPKAKKKKKK